MEAFTPNYGPFLLVSFSLIWNHKLKRNRAESRATLIYFIKINEEQERGQNLNFEQILRASY